MAKKRDEAYELRRIYEEMELNLIASMKRNLTRHEREERKMGFKFEQWQMARLRDLERFRRENKAIIGEYSKETEELINDTLITTYVESQENVNRIVKEIKDEYIDNVLLKLPGELEPVIDISVEPELLPVQKRLENAIENAKTWEETTRPIDDSFFRSNDKKLDSLMKIVDNDFEKANIAVQRRMDDIYRQTLFRTQVHFNQGVVSLDKAIDMATEDFLTKGIDAITYSDGKKVNIASYAEMALRTANHRAYLMGEGKKRQELGIPFVVVSAHATSCKLCVPWQGLILIDDVYSGGAKEDGPYPLLSEAMKEGLMHPNCRHNLGTYFHGITTLPKVPDSDKTLENYEQEQRQRALERAIRKQKRKVAGTVDKDNLDKEKDKLKSLQGDLRQHMKENPQLRRSYERERPGSGISNKDLKIHEETLNQKAMDDKIEDARNKILNGEYKLEIREQKQQEHILGTKQWVNRAKGLISKRNSPQGAFNKDVDIQSIIIEHKGTGAIWFRGNDIYPREYVDVGREIGIAFSRKDKRYLKTSRIAIHYSKKGVHAYPVIPKRKDGTDGRFK